MVTTGSPAEERTHQTQSIIALFTDDSDLKALLYIPAPSSGQESRLSSSSDPAICGHTQGRSPFPALGCSSSRGEGCTTISKVLEGPAGKEIMGQHEKETRIGFWWAWSLN